jgi:AcrR family transcriptional regulator
VPDTATSAHQTRATQTGGYRKGDETRRRILDAALTAFGANGFKGATTRQIVEAAGVNLPALTYYFGGKEGLYRACAEAIVERFRERMLTGIGEVQSTFGPEMTPDLARAGLKSIVGMLAEMLVGSRDSEIWTAFVLREMAEQGPAFAILYDQVWSPGIELVATLVARAWGEAAATEASRVEALMLISSLTAFSVARPVALKYLGWSATSGDKFDRILSAVERRIDRLR